MISSITAPPSRDALVRAPVRSGPLVRTRHASASLGSQQGPEHRMLETTANDLKEDYPEVYEWYTQKVKEVEEQCESSGVCDPLQSFETVVRELQGCGISSIARTLATLEKVDKHKHPEQPLHVDENELHRIERKRKRYEQLFLALGKRLDGHVTAMDLQDALPKLGGKHLLDSEIETLVEALEGKDSLHFGLSIDEFMSLLDTTTHWDESSDAQFLLHLPHTHHGSMDTCVLDPHQRF